MIIVLITIEDWLGLPQWIEWISLGVVFVGFIAFVVVSDRLTSRD